MDKSQSERAHEMAEFVRGFCKEIRPLYFYEWLSERYDIQSELGNDIYDKFADEIESLGKQDGLPYPLDKDGIPIKLGETVYLDNGQYKVIEIQYHDIGSDDIGVLVETRNQDDHTIVARFPKYLSHVKPRTLDDILQDAEASVYYAKDTGNIVDELIKEAYDLGLSDGAKKNE